MFRGCVPCVLLLGVLGCVEPPQRTTEARGAEQATTVIAPTPAPTPAEPPRQQLLTPAKDGFELLDAGAQPRTSLRFEPALGQIEALSVGVEMSVSISGDGIPPMSQRTPPIEQRSRIEVEALGAETIDTRIVLDSLSSGSYQSDVEASVFAAGGTKLLEGFEQSRSFGRRGGLDERGLEAPTDTDPSLAKSLRTLGLNAAALLVELPAAPVGVGAKWKQTRRFDNNGLAIARTTLVELVAQEGERLTLDLQISEQTSTERFVREGTPGEVEVVRFEGRGRGQVVYALDKLVPIRARMKLNTELEFAIASTDANEPRRTFDTKVSLTLQIPAN